MAMGYDENRVLPAVVPPSRWSPGTSPTTPPPGGWPYGWGPEDPQVTQFFRGPNPNIRRLIDQSAVFGPKTSYSDRYLRQQADRARAERWARRKRSALLGFFGQSRPGRLEDFRTGDWAMLGAVALVGVGLFVFRRRPRVKGKFVYTRPATVKV